jgi:TRAP-type uncharacterized transport system fused permease subunit
VAGFLVPFAFVYHQELLLRGPWTQVIVLSGLAAVSAVALASFVVGHAWGPVSGWLRGLCLVSAALLVARVGALQAMGLLVYVAVLLLSARRSRQTPAVSAA